MQHAIEVTVYTWVHNIVDIQETFPVMYHHVYLFNTATIDSNPVNFYNYEWIYFLNDYFYFITRSQ